MTDTARDLERILSSYADRADPARADLVDLVEHRYRRRRQRRIGATAAGLAVIVAVAVLSVSALHITASPVHPATSPSVTGPFVPPKDYDPAHRRPAFDVWPQATFHLPVRAPDGTLLVSIAAAVRPGQVLLTTRQAPYPLYAYNLADQSLRLLSGTLGTDRDGPGDFVVTPHWVLYLMGRGDPQSSLYRVPLAGGPPQLVTAQFPATGPLYATDDAIYWSGVDPGVLRLPLGGGQQQPLPGFEHMRIIDPSGWAVAADFSSQFLSGPWLGIWLRGEPLVAHTLRNVVTGATVPVTVPPGTVSLTCAPTFCKGDLTNAAHDPNTYQHFVERPDGSHLTMLPGSFSGCVITSNGVSVITDGNSYIYDPATGRTGFLPPNFTEDSLAGESPNDAVWSEWWTPAGSVTSSTTLPVGAATAIMVGLIGG